MPTFASLFSGGGGADVGASSVGLQSTWAIEIEPQIAEVYTENLGHQPAIGSVADVNPNSLERPNVLWASVPCQAFSIARNKKLPERADVGIGLTVVPFLEVLQPDIFILENVEAYRKAQSFYAIVDCLHRLGYGTDWQVLNAADFGVPQTRRRLILRAVKNGFVPPLPLAQKWVSWLSAIADLIPTLPETEFAPWQLKHLSELPVTTLVERVGSYGKPNTRSYEQPSWTVRALGHDRHWRQMDAFILPKEVSPEKAWFKQGKTLVITPRALARLQSFPDNYQLPESNPLASRIVGNAVPPLLAKKLLEIVMPLSPKG